MFQNHLQFTVWWFLLYCVGLFCLSLIFWVPCRAKCCVIRLLKYLCLRYLPAADRKPHLLPAFWRKCCCQHLLQFSQHTFPHGRTLLMSARTRGHTFLRLLLAFIFAASVISVLWKLAHLLLWLIVIFNVLWKRSVFEFSQISGSFRWTTADVHGS